jgi:hypothetical protein
MMVKALAIAPALPDKQRHAAIFCRAFFWLRHQSRLVGFGVTSKTVSMTCVFQTGSRFVPTLVSLRSTRSGSAR